MQRDIHEQNRRSWNAATIAHNSHKGDQAAFFRNGGSTLFAEERELLGDVAGLSVVHLQCNAGQDTLSIAQLGARVTGVDISDEAIAFASRLSDESGVAARFIRSDVFDWLEEAAANPAERFDVAYASYGALCWLSDLHAYFRGVAGILKPGGRYVIVDFHPTMGLFDEEWRLAYPSYQGEGPALTWDEGIHDYVAQSAGGLDLVESLPGVENFVNPHPCTEFTWSTGEILSAMLAAGLTIETYREYPWSNGFKPYPDMVSLEGRRWGMPSGKPALPLMYGVIASSLEDS